MGGSDWYPPCTNCARLYKIGRIFRAYGNGDLGVLATHVDFEVISEVGKVSVPNQERRKNRTDAIEIAHADLKAMFASYLTKDANVIHGCEVVDRKKMLMGLGEIEKLHVGEAGMAELKAWIGGWEVGYMLAIKSQAKH